MVPATLCFDIFMLLVCIVLPKHAVFVTLKKGAEVYHRKYIGRSIKCQRVKWRGSVTDYLACRI